MKIGNFDTNDSVFIIAEIGNNHEGNFDVACRHVEAAAKTGVNAVKFQSIVPEKLVTIDQTDRIQQLKRFQLSLDEYERLAKLSERCGVYFMSTPFDLDMVDFLNRLVPAYKISSGDNNYYKLLEKVATTGKPVILSSGMAGVEDIRFSQNCIKNVWKEKNLVQAELAILHCVSNYPTVPELAEISAVKYIADQFNCVTGYSDHTIGITAAILSVSFGGRIIEKHFTLDNNYSDFRDHKISADPKMMRYLVDSVREAEKMIGSFEKRVGKNEAEIKLQARRSAAAIREIKEGEIITEELLTWLRPGTGIGPGEESTIIGKRTLRSIKEGIQIKREDLE